jgi:hypothetical protein
MTLQLNDTLYFSSINFNPYCNDFWTEAYDIAAPGGKFAIDLARRINPNRFVSRDNSVWSLPWPQEIIPKYRMADYDAGFSMSFSDVTDNRALEIKRRINDYNHKFAVMYSGGIDSLTIVVALLKNLTTAELENVSLCTSVGATVEHPTFWKKYISGKIKIIDSLRYKYHDLINQGYYPITGDDGDCIFGTVFGLNLYHDWERVANTHNFSEEQKSHIRNNLHRFNDPSYHYSNFKDLLIAYMSIPPNQTWPIVGQANPNPQFGQLMYDKYDLNARTTAVPVNSLHDFFWWLIFNVKMLNCGVRGALYYNDYIAPEQAIHAVENWYNGELYQKWSMNNNGNGQKILHSPATYKMAARNYIYDFDQNKWYKNFKLKLESMALVTQRQEVDETLPLGRPVTRFGITKNYELLHIDQPDVQEYIKHHLANFQIDWSDAGYEV